MCVFFFNFENYFFQPLRFTLNFVAFSHNLQTNNFARETRWMKVKFQHHFLHSMLRMHTLHACYVEEKWCWMLTSKCLPYKISNSSFPTPNNKQYFERHFNYIPKLCLESSAVNLHGSFKYSKQSFQFYRVSAGKQTQILYQLFLILFLYAIW